MIGDTPFPRSIAVAPPKENEPTFAEVCGFPIKNDIGPCRAVGVVGPRLKKLKFYNWERKFN